MQSGISCNASHRQEQQQQEGRQGEQQQPESSRQGRHVPGVDGSLLTDPLGPIAAFRLFTSDAQKHRNLILQSNIEGMAAATDWHKHILVPLAEQAKTLAGRIDHASKILSRTLDLCEKELVAKDNAQWNTREINKARKTVDVARHAAIERLKQVRYFQRHAAWLIERFPDAELRAVPGLCKVVTRADIEVADWSLTPGRYIDVAPAEIDEEFDFEQTLRDIHIELDDLNVESSALAARIQTNFEALVI